MVATIQNQTFGVEIEFYGMTRYEAIRVVARVLGTENFIQGTETRDLSGRKWKVVYDSSIRNPRGQQCELVSPILNYGDIETLQNIVRGLREAGMGVNETTGIHIHVGADAHNAKSLKNLANIIYSKQDILYKALKVEPYREAGYAKKLSPAFIEKLKTEKPGELNSFGRIWYGGPVENNQTKYNSSRYHGLNFHNVWYGATVEFRLFNSTSHAGRLKAYIQFILAVSALAINSKSSRSAVTTSSNEKYTFRTWLLRLGLNGDEFKTCRHHMLANLDGDIAWRNAQ